MAGALPRCWNCNGELVDLLHALPSGTIDAVASEHSHSVLDARIDGVPVVQAGWKGEFLNVIDLPLTTTTCSM